MLKVVEYLDRYSFAELTVGLLLLLFHICFGLDGHGRGGMKQICHFASLDESLTLTGKVL